MLQIKIQESTPEKDYHIKNMTLGMVLDHGVAHEVTNVQYVGIYNFFLIIIRANRTKKTIQNNQQQLEVRLQFC